jgi:protein TonB
MLAYAANAPRHAERRPSPNAMLVVIAVHVAALAALMSAKMDLPTRIFDPPPTVVSIPLPKPPPTPVVTPTRPQSNDAWIDHPTPQVPVPPLPNLPIDTGESTLPPGPAVGPAVTPTPTPQPLPSISARRGAELLTPASELKPPYPQSKLLTEEEAVLRLKLTIDERGRIVAVDPVGRADSVFLAAARRHLMAHWRYKPASEDGRAVASSTVITLRFQLNG